MLLYARIVFSIIFMGQEVTGPETLAATVVCTFRILGHDAGPRIRSSGSTPREPRD